MIRQKSNKEKYYKKCPAVRPPLLSLVLVIQALYSFFQIIPITIFACIMFPSISPLSSPSPGT